MNKLFYVSILLSILSIASCKTNRKALFGSGVVNKTEFESTVTTRTIKYLTIIPVEIHGKTYQFLFDTGAPLSISSDIQKALQFPTVRKIPMVDSDHVRREMQFVKSDSINIGGISFLNHTAFVADFSLNPLIKCLNIDGIIGSNLMKECNWTINHTANTITLSKNKKLKSNYEVPFKSNLQYDMIVDLDFDGLSYGGIKIDYGSNGELSLPQYAIDGLKKEIIDTIIYKKGYKQHGLFGVRSPMVKEIAKVDSVRLDNFVFPSLIVRSGKSGLLGNKTLSNYIVNINWKNKTIGFTKQNSKQDKNYSDFGFSLTFHNGETKIQAVTQGSHADKQGLLADQIVKSMNGIDFPTSESFCNYITMSLEHLDEITLLLLQKDKSVVKKVIKRSYYFKNN
ncbi:MAG: aspartyl protease family protein [Flavobacteriales bacterium]